VTPQEGMEAKKEIKNFKYLLYFKRLESHTKNRAKKEKTDPFRTSITF